MHKILLVDGDSSLCSLLSKFLVKNNYAVSSADSGQGATEWMKKNKPDLVLCNFMLNDMTGVKLLGKIRETHPKAIVVMIADQGSVKEAVDAFQAGAIDYITKPLFPDEILLVVKKVLTANTKETVIPIPAQKSTKINAKPAKAYNDQYIAGNSPEFDVIIKQIDLVAPTDFSVIIYGESGCGKEAIAQQIHQESKRAGKPFVAIDCGALSKELAGSEFFGHEKGAFTGALNQKIGSLEIANTGTIFLDEIGNLSYDIQVSLLRVVQERKIRRVGGIKDIDIDIRIIIASNINLWEATKTGKFREDLYHRFNEFSIAVPSLNERKQDILLFAHHFLKHTNAELGKDIKGFTKEVEYLLSNYIWYGNLRELKNVIKRATLLTSGDVIEVKSLPFEVTDYFKAQFKSPLAVKTELQIINTNSNANTQISYELIPPTISLNKEADTVKQSDYNKSKVRRLKNDAKYDICIPAS